MGPAATGLAARSALRRTWRGAVVLGVLLGLVAGVVAAALAGAHRVESAYDRLLDDIDAPDFVVLCDVDCIGPGSPGERIGAEPTVAGVTAVSTQFVAVTDSAGRQLGPAPDSQCNTGAGEVGLITSDWAHTGRPPSRLMSGRLPAPGSLDEVVLPSITADRAGLAVGDTVYLAADCSSDEDSGTPLPTPRPLRVVGTAVGFIDVRPPGNATYYENLIVSEALAGSTGFRSQTLLFGWLDPGRGVDDLSPDVRDTVFLDVATHADVIRGDLRPDATALRLFALVAFVGVIAVLGQLLAASVSASVSLNRVIGAIGARRRDLGVLGVVHGMVVGSVAALTAVIVVLVGLPLVPLGAADPIERSRGIGLPITLALITGTLTLAGIVVLSVAPAALAARSAERHATPRAGRWPTRTAHALGLPPPPALGMRFALEPAGEPRRTPIRSALGALILSIAAVAGAITFVAGLEHLRATPRLVGWNWDVLLGLADEDVDTLAAAIAARPDVERSGRGIVFPSPVSFTDDFSVIPMLMGFDAVPTGVEPSVTHGRAPEGPDELLLSPGLAASRDLAIGDVIDLHSINPIASRAEDLGLEWSTVTALGIPEAFRAPFEVVAIGVIPAIGGQLDLGASVTLDGYARLFPTPSRADVMKVFAAVEPADLGKAIGRFVGPLEHLQLVLAGPDGTLSVLRGWSDEQFAPLIPRVEAQGVFVDVAPGHDVSAVLEDLVASGQIAEDGIFLPGGVNPDATDIVLLDLDDVGWIPAGFGILMGATGFVVLAFVVTTGASARRREVATLRALGLSGGQTRATVGWQSVVTALFGLAIGVPIGVVGGRLIWTRYAEGLAVVPEPVTPWGLLVILAAATLAVAILVSIVPAWRSARHPPIASLRAE